MEISNLMLFYWPTEAAVVNCDHAPASSPAHSRFFNVTFIEKSGMAWGRGYNIINLAQYYNIVGDQGYTIIWINLTPMSTCKLWHACTYIDPCTERDAYGDDNNYYNSLHTYIKDSIAIRDIVDQIFFYSCHIC